MKEDTLSAAAVREILNYDPDTDHFTWRVNRPTPRQIGKRAGSLKKNGYRSIHLTPYSWSEHRLAWLYVHGEWPRGFIDHINHEPGDNRISNLRVATVSQNVAHTRVPPKNKHGLRGIWFDPSMKSTPWCATIRMNGKANFLGMYATAEEAAAAYKAAAERVHGEFSPEVYIAEHK
jgi:hypothetical protein